MKNKLIIVLFGLAICVAIESSLKAAAVAPAEPATFEGLSPDVIENICERLSFGDLETLTVGSNIRISEIARTVLNKKPKLVIDYWSAEHIGSTVLAGHNDSVYSVAFSPNGKLLASGDNKGIIIVWDVKTGAEKTRLLGHTDRVQSVKFLPGGNYLASGSNDGTVRLWNLKSGKEIMNRRAGSPVNSVAFSPDSKLLAYGCRNKIINIVDMDIREIKSTMNAGERYEGVLSVEFSPDGKLFAAGADNGRVRIWNVDNFSLKYQIRALSHHMDINSITFSHDSKSLASGSELNSIIIWDPQSGQKIKTLQGEIPFDESGANFVISLAFVRGDRLLASAHQNGTIKLWNVETGKEIKELRSRQAVMSVAFSPDGTSLASGSLDNSVKLWKPAK